ncbi:hypothetical protein KIN20_029354 [Parelaphostrongylus tenuis]|uniref:Uncharacterized protein n=1 Tax=Parelaphostrongylus tenuis TaxID=148309 RepID=A0AAD5R294_PARTN|nr:hypothetical protein KIN20_029354 [Parelaphostrongylus tenuis]
MSYSTFIESFYFPSASSVPLRHVEQDAVECRRLIAPPQIPEHYSALKPVEPSKRLIESSYCISSEHTRESHRLYGNSKTNATNLSVNQQPLAPGQSLPELNYKASEYAWKRLDKELKELYAIRPNYGTHNYCHFVSHNEILGK